MVDRPGTIDPDQLRRAVRSIQSHGAVAVLGAGLSASRYPMTNELPSLLWHAIDAVPDARAELETAWGETGTAKQLLGTDPDRLRVGWRLARESAPVRTAFQGAFSHLDLDREPTGAHENLARMVHEGLIELVISFNWDTALERAYLGLFGTPLVADGTRYAKPHGDAARSDQAWVLPDEDGVVPPALLARMRQMAAERPRTLVVLGYSKSDEKVVESLLAPTEAAWSVVNIGPSTSGDDALTGTADAATDGLLSMLDIDAEPPDWRWVTFSRSRDLSAALLGYRLGPQDVAACPELPAAARLAQRLTAARFATLTGDSGSGKSVTAFHAARRLNALGWGVVELARPGVASDQSVRRFSRLPGPVLAVVDDAQAMDPDLRAAFERASSDDHAVLLVSTLRGASPEEESVSATAAVEHLVRYCETHSDTVLPLVRALDDRVGTPPFRENFQDRLALAARSQYPWQFMYLLSGGERRIGTVLERLDQDPAQPHLLLGVVACQQLLTLDAGITTQALLSEGERAGLGPETVRAGIETLTRERLLLDRQGRLRTPHLRLADRALARLCAHPREPHAQTLLGYLQGRLADPTQNLRGRLWVIDALEFVDALRYGNLTHLINDDTARQIVAECLAAAPGRDRSVAGHLLFRAGFFGAFNRELDEQIAAALPAWIRTATAEEVSGLRWALNYLRGSEPDLHARVVSEVGPEPVAARLCEHVTVGTAAAWADLITELLQPKDLDHRAWGRAFEVAADDAQLIERLLASHTDGLYGLPELIDRLVFTTPSLGIEIFTATFPLVRAGLEVDLAATSARLFHWAFGMMGLLVEEPEGPEDGEDTSVDWDRVRDTVVSCLSSVDWEQAARSLDGSALHDLHNFDLLAYWLAALCDNAMNRLTRNIPIDWLERITTDHWHDSDATSALLWALGQGSDRTVATGLLARHHNEIRTFPGRLAATYPDVAASLIHCGSTVPLPVDRGLRWDECADAIQAIADVDRTAARLVVEAATDDVLDGFHARQNNMVTHVGAFIEAVEAVAPGHTTDLTGRLDPDEVEPHWRARISGSADEAAEMTALLTQAARGVGATADLARVLLDRHMTSNSTTGL